MKSTLRHRWTIGAAALFAIVVLPLCGVLAAGGSIEPYLEFPPRTRVVVHASFSWPVFFALALGIMSALGPFAFRVLSSRGPSSFREAPLVSRPSYSAGDERVRHVSSHLSHPPAPRPPGRALSPGPLLERRRFPWWGWAGLIWTALAWIVAWKRWEWIGQWQLHTFTPLWCGYIVVMNALTVARTGTSVMRRHPGYFLLLFPLSAAFWWTFEYLNRFVQNWHYVGGREFTSAEYLVLATIPFSTVLPAVISTADWLSTYPSVGAGLERAWAVRIVQSRRVGWTILLAAAGGLIGIGLWPDYLFPLVWVAPLLLIAGLQLANGDETVFSPASQGDWRLLWVVALASLICGLFWELWNSRSLAHWEYTIPFTHRFQLFEMPLLGYAGYLPFGLECVAVVQLFIPADWICLPAQNQSAHVSACGDGVFERCSMNPS